MLSTDQIRQLARLGACGLLGFAMHAVAQTSSPPATPAQAKPAPAKSAQSAAAPAAKSKKHNTTAATGKRASSRSSSHSSSHSSTKTRGKKVATKRGQQGIDSARAREIQAALIHENYLHGEPSGSWDAATQDAMRKFQADHGWQSKTIPDSRALIRLGLGPSSDHLLNPESAMTAPPTDPKSAAKQTPAHDNLPHQ
jgi:peptidoglycan hydrolase-like protein with peptidoglycan-binding domain